MHRASGHLDNMNDVLNNVIGSGPEQKSLDYAGKEN